MVTTKTKIDWCDFSWNPVWGCRHDCPFCYARGLARRFGKKIAGRNDFEPVWIQANFDSPMPRQPSRIFVDSMSDVACWKEEWIAAVKKRMARNREHLFLILTKGRQPNTWRTENVLFGSTAIDQAALEAVPKDRDFVSIEPIVGPVDLAVDLPDLGWIIVGAETGNRKDRIIPESSWIESIRTRCRELELPLFEKNNLMGLMGKNLVREYPDERRLRSRPR
ncbi:hypothetical protein ES708_11107 [subsurface metagenome]